MRIEFSYIRVSSLCFRTSQSVAAALQRAGEPRSDSHRRDNRAVVYFARYSAAHVSLVPRIRVGNDDDLQLGEDTRACRRAGAAIRSSRRRRQICLPCEQYCRFRESRTGSLHHKQPLHPSGASTGSYPVLFFSSSFFFSIETMMLVETLFPAFTDDPVHVPIYTLLLSLSFCFSFRYVELSLDATLDV